MIKSRKRCRVCGKRHLKRFTPKEMNTMLLEFKAMSAKEALQRLREGL